MLSSGGGLGNQTSGLRDEVGRGNSDAQERRRLLMLVVHDGLPLLQRHAQAEPVLAASFAVPVRQHPLRMAGIPLRQGSAPGAAGLLSQACHRLSTLSMA